jgi:hypothetical protein
MTSSVPSIHSTPRTRRALLAGALGGLGAFAASVVARTNPVQAANGDPVLLGQLGTATAATGVTRTTSGDAFYGTHTDSDAVNGYSQTGRGVYGSSSSNAGVFGTSNTGPGLWGYGGSGFGIALKTDGRLKLSTSGVATINAGQKSKTITPGVDINSGSFVLLTPKANIGGRALWFTTDGPNERFTIHMSSARGISTKVAWLLLG